MRKTIAQIAMEAQSLSINRLVDERVKQLNRIRKRNYHLATEGLFDWFKKKNEDKHESPSNQPTSVEWWKVDEKEHYEKLLNASRVSVHLKTDSVRNEIDFTTEMIKSGIPLFRKDIHRLKECLNFIIKNGESTIDKLDQLTKLSYLDRSIYPLDEKRKVISFKTFYITSKNSDITKGEIPDIHPELDVMEIITLDDFSKRYNVDVLPKEENDKFQKMYFLGQAIPSIDLIIPIHKASSSQKRIYLNNGDSDLKKLLDLNLELYRLCKNINVHDSGPDEFGITNMLEALAVKADRASFPIDVWESHGYVGTSTIVAESCSYASEIRDGFQKHFIQHYTAH